MRRARQLSLSLPSWGGKRNANGHLMKGYYPYVDFYYWYYGTLAMFQMGGHYWKAWNAELKATLVPNQCRGGPLDGSAKDVDGSWNPVGTFGVKNSRGGGRVMSTALGALCLEVYYRYMPMVR